MAPPLCIEDRLLPVKAFLDSRFSPKSTIIYAVGLLAGKTGLWAEGAIAVSAIAHRL